MLQTPTPLSKVLSAPAWAERRPLVLKTVAVLAEFHPPLNDYVRGGATQPLAVTPQALPSLLFETLPALRLMGIRTLLPRALERLLRPRLSMQINAKRSSGRSAEDRCAVLLRLESVAGRQPHQRRRSSSACWARPPHRPFPGPVRLPRPGGDRAFACPPGAAGTLSDAELLRVALAGEVDGAPVGLNKAAEKLIQQLPRARTCCPKGLRATLRPYQQRGYAWLWRNARLGLGSVIADDMGLGKTLQVITLLQRLKEDGALDEGRALVIVPTSLLTNWQKEVERFAPDLRVGIFHGARRELAKERPDVLLTTYGVARQATLLKAMSWRLLVIDEAQKHQEPGGGAVSCDQEHHGRRIHRDERHARGEPALGILVDHGFVQRGYLGGPTHFAREYATPIQTHRDAAAAERLRKVMAPFMLRRLKSDKTIISDLPDKVEQDQFFTLAASRPRSTSQWCARGSRASPASRTPSSARGWCCR